MKKILAWLKIVALYIKKVIKVLLKAFARSLYVIMAIGYIGALGTAYYAQNTVKSYNSQAIEYAKTADSSYKAYETIKNIDKLQDEVEAKLKSQYKQAEKNISASIKNVDEKDLAKEMLFKGKKIEQTTFVQNIKAEVRESFNINLSKEFKSITSKQESNSSISTILDLLTSEKIVMMILLLLSFPFLSPIVLACVVVVIMSKKYLKHISNPNSANYITMVPSTYIMNMVLAIASVVVFYFEQNTGLAIAAVAHLLFIWKLFNGILLRKMDHCLSCGQAFPDELEEAKKLKAQVKPKGKTK
jgi:hypothetical protein